MTEKEILRDKQLNEKIVSLRREINAQSTETIRLLKQTVESLTHSIALVGVIDEAVNCITTGTCANCSISEEMRVSGVCDTEAEDWGSCTMNVKKYLLKKAADDTKKKIDNN